MDKLPKHIQARVKDNLHQIWMDETKEKAEKAFEHFIQSFESGLSRRASLHIFCRLIGVKLN